MKPCPNIPLMSAFHDGELPVEKRAELERHLSTCAECTSELNELRRMSVLFGTKRAEPISSGAMKELHQQVDALTDRSLLRFAQMLSGIAAAVLLMAGAWAMQAPQAVDSPATGWDQTAMVLRPDALGQSDALLPAPWMVVEFSPRQSHD